MSKEIQDILLGQLELLSELSKSDMIEPELVVKVSLAMVEIAKLFNLYSLSRDSRV